MGIIRPRDGDDLQRELCRAAGLTEWQIQRLDVLRDLIVRNERDDLTPEWKRLNFMRELFKRGRFWRDGGPIPQWLRDRAA